MAPMNSLDMFAAESWHGDGGHWNHGFEKSKQGQGQAGDHSNKDKEKSWNQRKTYGGDFYTKEDSSKWGKHGKNVNKADKWDGHKHGHDWKNNDKKANKIGGEWGRYSFEYLDFDKGSFKNYDTKEEYGDKENYHGEEKEGDYKNNHLGNDGYYGFKGEENKKSNHGNDHYKKSQHGGHHGQHKGHSKKESKGKAKKHSKKNNKGSHGQKSADGHNANAISDGKKYTKKIHHG